MKIAAGWYEKGLGNALGFLIGALVLGTAFPHLLKGGLSSVPWQAVIVLSSGVCLLGGLLMFLLIPDGPYLVNGARFNPRAVIKLFRHRELRAAALGYFGHMWELYTLWAFVPVFLAAYLSSVPGLSLNVSFWSFLIIGIGSVGCIVGGLVSARVGSARVAFLQLVVSGICCLSLPSFSLPPGPVPGLHAALGNGRGWGFTPIFNHRGPHCPPGTGGQRPDPGQLHRVFHHRGQSVTDAVDIGHGAPTVPPDPVGRRTGDGPGLHEIPRGKNRQSRGRRCPDLTRIEESHQTGAANIQHLRFITAVLITIFQTEPASDSSPACPMTRLMMIPWDFPKAMTASGRYSPAR
jgi:hypothetical protein